MSKRSTRWMLLVLTVLPAFASAQILGRGQESPVEPTRTPRSIFRRLQATPAAEQPAVPEATPTPAKPKTTPAREAEPKRPRETSQEKPREVTRAKETPKPRTTPKATPEPKEEKPKVDAATLARDRDISDTLKLVTEFLKAAHLGHYAEAQRALTPPVQKYFEGEHSAVGGGLKRVLDTITRDGTIRNVTNEAVLRGDGARVESEVLYEDGSRAKWTFDLLRTKEGWRIELDVPSVLKAAGAKSQPQPTPLATPAPTPAPTPQPQAAAPTPAETPAPTPAVTPQSALSDAPWKKAN